MTDMKPSTRYNDDDITKGLPIDRLVERRRVDFLLAACVAAATEANQQGHGNDEFFHAGLPRGVL